MSEGPTPEQLAGTWHLHRFVVERAGREPLQPFGPDARGQILYAPDGWMSAVLSRGDRDALSVDGLEAATSAPVERRAAAFDGYLSYAGRWRLERAPDGLVRVHHEVTLALVPDIVGSVLTRTAQLEDDGALTLTYDTTTRSGAPATGRLTWRRPA